MNASRKYSVRFALIGLLAALAAFAAPSAFARSHWSVGVNVGGPGWGVGYSDCHHCGWGGGYGYGYVGSYYPSYYPAYYSPVYYSSYYPAYYTPAYTSVYYYDRPVRHHRYYRSYDRHYDGYRGHRASYYDRGGYYRD